MTRYLEQLHLVLTPDAINATSLATFPESIRLMISLRFYARGLAKLEAKFPTCVKTELANTLENEKQMKHQLAQILSGGKLDKIDDMKHQVLKLALAINGDTSVYKGQTGTQTFEGSHLFLEGKFILGNKDAGKEADIELCRTVLQENQDSLIRAMIAQWMIETQNPIYIPLIFELSEIPSNDFRISSLRPLRMLARKGDATALDRLRSMAQNDPDKNIRKTAEDYLKQL